MLCQINTRKEVNEKNNLNNLLITNQLEYPFDDLIDVTIDKKLVQILKFYIQYQTEKTNLGHAWPLMVLGDLL